MNVHVTAVAGLLSLLLSAPMVADDLDAPSCTRYFATDLTSEIHGRVTVAAGQSVGLLGIRLADGSDNLSLKSDSDFQSGDASIDFILQPVNAFRDASGTVVGEDQGGRVCSLPVAINAIYNRTNPSPLCRLGDLVLTLRNPRIRTPGNAACSITDLGPAEPRLPEGFEPLPGSPFDPFPCKVLTVHSPFHGLKELKFGKTGRFQRGERLLVSESPDGGRTFPDFVDITEEVLPQHSFRPVTTHWLGLAYGTPFKVTCALAPVEGRSKLRGR